jgi:hypothetical protein
MVLENGYDVTAFDDHVLVVAGTGCNPSVPDEVASILSLPVLFDAATTPATLSTTHDHCGWDWAVGPERAYYAPQTNEAIVEACNGTECTRVVYPGVHPNGLAYAGDVLLMGYWLGGENNAIKSAPIGALGVPSSTVADRASSPRGAVQFVLYDPLTDAVWWQTTFTGGCIHRLLLAEANDVAVPECHASATNDGDHVHLAIAPGRGAYFSTTGAAGTQLWFVGEEAGSHVSFGSVATTGKVEADARYAYVSSPQGGFAVLDGESGALVTTVSAPVVEDMAANHADFVFFTSGDELFRWRKLPP